MLEPRFVQPLLFNAIPSLSEPSPALNNLSPENNPSSHSDALDWANLKPVQANSVDAQGDRSASESTQPYLNQSSEPFDAESLERNSAQGATHNPSDDRLDESSLNTVLDMLAVIDTIEELALLELLTDTQKRQVWDVTPEEVKTKLKQLRQSTKHPPATSGTSSDSASELGLARSQQSSTEQDLEDSLEDSEAQDLRQLDELSYSEEWHEDETIEPDFTPIETAYSNQQPTLTVGDWVVLRAHSKLTAAELQAIWEVVEVHQHQNIARIQTKGVGTRSYPIAWMVLYPKPRFN